MEEESFKNQTPPVYLLFPYLDLWMTLTCTFLSTLIIIYLCLFTINNNNLERWGFIYILFKGNEEKKILNKIYEKGIKKYINKLQKVDSLHRVQGMQLQRKNK
jgi:hypothetical protein